MEGSQAMVEKKPAEDTAPVAHEGPVIDHQGGRPGPVWPPDRGGQTPDDGEAPAIVGAAEAAMHMFHAAIEALPDQKDGSFVKRADVILTGLRKLEASLSLAAGRSRATPSVVVALSQARRSYATLMKRAALAPSASLGQRIYAARRGADLTIQEAANGVGLRADLLEAIENGEPTTQEETTKIKALIAALDG
jgi:DNA-binding XRE family transcriptional regulator